MSPALLRWDGASSFRGLPSHSRRSSSLLRNVRGNKTASIHQLVAEVVVARRFGDDRRDVGDGNVRKVQEAELNLHREQDLQLAAHRFTAHLPAQENAQSIRPQAELSERGSQRGNRLHLYSIYNAHREEETLMKTSKAHICSGGGDEVQAGLFNIICDAKCQVQHLLQWETGELLTLLCLPLFSFMWGQSFPVSKPLISATGTERGGSGTKRRALTLFLKSSREVGLLDSVLVICSLTTCITWGRRQGDKGTRDSTLGRGVWSKTKGRSAGLALSPLARSRKVTGSHD
ncbi:hypothetical protein EYF80_021569 [Liparis tanakae]|uniref:Uncharacterized protein n=1 Tax=Liparis tanakae TaxID=230148 RepID=A0A4Z2HRA9_9TELE|nr:hypothetical protein EYF80_021569 [Liparis tanakae]